MIPVNFLSDQSHWLILLRRDNFALRINKNKKRKMKALKYLLLVIVVFPFTCYAVSGSTSYVLNKDYSVIIEGTSNLHSWSETVNNVSGSCSFNSNSDGTFDLDGVTITMDVYSIKSDMGSVMNKKTYTALKAAGHPEITFTLVGPIRTIHSSTDISAEGNLTIAGITRTVKMHVNVIHRNGQLIVEGSQTLNMTDFGIQPPTALFGSLKTADVIKISFKADFVPVANS